MNRIAILLTCLALGCGTATAQQDGLTLKGRVTDSRTREPLPYATIYTADRLHYTTTNADGDYVMKLPAGAATTGRLVFAQTGYHRDTVDVATLARKGNVRLVPGNIELREVQVTGYRNAKSLMKEVIKRIPQNYHTDTMLCTGFFRQARVADDTLYLFVEHVSDLLRVGYGKNPKIKFTNYRYINSNYSAMRRMQLLANDTNYLNRLTRSSISTAVLANHDDVEFLDPVEVYKSLLKVGRDATVHEFDDADGTPYYLVEGDTKRITIDKATLAITRIEQNMKMGTPIVIPIGMIPKGKEMTPIRKFAISNHCVYTYDKVGDRYTLVAANGTSHTEYYNDTTGIWHGVAPKIVCHEYSTFQLIGNQPGSHTSVDMKLRQRFENYADVPVSDHNYNPDYWQQFNYIPIEAAILEKIKALKQ